MISRGVRSVIMLEFNELSPTLMDRFIADGHLPAFKRLRDNAATYITEAGESESRLNPWVQWVTVHTGATAEEHGIEKLGEAGLLRLPTIADAVTRAGGSVWLCGSMNVQPIEPIAGAFLPDPWRADATPQPVDLVPFFRFVSANVQEHTNEARSLSTRDVLAFGRFLATHGLSFRTAQATVAQLIGERTSRADRKRRAALLDRFQWDVFAHYYHRIQPRFATFFSNSTAHFQHLRWSETEDDATGSLVLDGYQQMDRLVDRALALAAEDAVVVLCTALSQSARRDDSAFEGFYRLRSLDSTIERLGVVGVVRTAPMMAGQCHLYFDSEESASVGSRLLGGVTLDDRQALDVVQNEDDLVVGCPIFTRQPAELSVRLPDDRQVSFDELFYWNEAPREGTHHPDGILWIGGGRTRETARVPLTSVAPTLLSLLDIGSPASMKGELLGLGIP